MVSNFFTKVTATFMLIRRKCRDSCFFAEIYFSWMKKSAIIVLIYGKERMRMTRRLRWLCLAAVALTMLLAAGAARADDVSFGLLKTDGISLRQEPNASSASVGQYPMNTWMAVTGDVNGWYAVTAPDGVKGYVTTRQLQLPEIFMANVGVVANLADSGYVNLRESPYYQAEVLATYHNGAPCLLLSHTNGWYHVRVEGMEGYLREEYLQPGRMLWTEETATVITQGGAMLELRAGPGAQYAPLARYSSGQYVILLGKGLGWWYVSVDGLVGFMEESALRQGILTYTEIVDAGWKVLSGAYAVVKNPVDTQLLNMRETPSRFSNVLRQYGSGARLTLLNQGLEWCRVMNDQGEIGYMMTEYLKLEGVPETPVMTVTHPDKTFVNLRTVPSTVLGAVQAQVPHGEQVTVLIPGSEWVKVRYGELEGYMVAWFLTE